MALQQPELVDVNFMIHIIEKLSQLQDSNIKLSTTAIQSFYTIVD